MATILPVLIVKVHKIGRNAGGTEIVVADSGFDAGRCRASLNHAVGVLLPHSVARKFAGLAGRRFIAPGQSATIS